MDTQRIMHSIYFLLLLLLAAFPGEPATAQTTGRESAEPETVIISGVATPRNQYTYRLEPFSVPAHTGRIEVEFEYTGRGDFAEIEIGLFDPHGFRGTSRSEERRVGKGVHMGSRRRVT